MSPKATFVLINYVLILISFRVNRVHSSDGSGVPVFIWGTHRQNSQVFESKPKSTITQIDANVLSDDYLKQWPTVVAFLQNHLSVEQFSVPKHFHHLNHIFSDKTLDSIFLTDVLSPDESFKEFFVQNANDLNINDGKKVVINLPKNDLLENEELIGDLWHKISHNVSQNVLFVITGRHNTQTYNKSGVEVNHRFRRAVKPNDDLDRLVSIESCLYFFTRSLTLTYNPGQRYGRPIVTTFDTIPRPALGESKCWTDGAKGSALLDLTYTNTDGTLNIKLTIDMKKSGYWFVSKGTAVVGSARDNQDYELNVNGITAANKLSYSCSNLKIDGLDDVEDISIVFNKFQLQPFENPVNPKKYIFTDSDACEVFMTVPLWMGLLTISLFLIILLLGLYMLWRVSPPDRFENPKGKALILTTVDE